MREGGVYSGGAVEKGGDANVAERKLTERQKEFCRLCAAGMKPIWLEISSLAEISLQGQALIESCTHIFEDGEHRMQMDIQIEGV